MRPCPVRLCQEMTLPQTHHQTRLKIRTPEAQILLEASDAGLVRCAFCRPLCVAGHRCARRRVFVSVMKRAAHGETACAGGSPRGWRVFFVKRKAHRIRSSGESFSRRADTKGQVARGSRRATYSFLPQRETPAGMSLKGSSLSGRGSDGRPRTRSPIILRCI